MLEEHHGRLSARLSWSVATGALLLLAGLSCTAESRYRVLTVFFEGVPPPGAREAAQKAASEAAAARRPAASFHAAFRRNDCTECHVGKSRVLKIPIPGLCRTCHERPPESNPWLHAPARSGECAGCHVGHESEFRALLVADGPALCYRCHRDTFVQSLPAHEKLDLSTCEKCHPAHEGGTVGVPRRIEEAPDPIVAPKPEDRATTAPQIPKRPVPRDTGTTQGIIAPIFED
jgi:predicted CXXCH cytochrome family protein